jgi:O6-methylguanine-DNA--protein-cysteine methyltransferase
MKKRSSSLIALLTLCTLVSSCAGLKESAASVKYTTTTLAPSDCNALGEVSAGSIISYWTMTSARNALLNRTAAMGGNFLIIDDLYRVSGLNGTFAGFAGHGRAFQCP